ncbi:MAG: PAS/PAC sensor hybrid histidine kinase [Puniceicoccaceae bacterium 5H]|nr:MAG: PAS/PAC sensor hybrid histidine kinase [Puniceicoccaceae bacterium 5H]
MLTAVQELSQKLARGEGGHIVTSCNRLVSRALELTQTDWVAVVHFSSASGNIHWVTVANQDHPAGYVPAADDANPDLSPDWFQLPIVLPKGIWGYLVVPTLASVEETYTWQNQLASLVWDLAQRLASAQPPVIEEALVQQLREGLDCQADEIKPSPSFWEITEHLLNSQGGALLYQDNQETHGDTPSEGQRLELLQLLREYNTGLEPLMLPGEPRFDQWSGTREWSVAAVPFESEEGSYFLFFRRREVGDWSHHERLTAGVLQRVILQALQQRNRAQKRIFWESTQRMVEELRQLSVVASRTTCGVFIADRHGHLNWANEALLGMVSVSLEQLLGKDPLQILEGSEGLLTSLSGNDKRYQRECRLRQVTDGLERWVSVEITPLGGREGHHGYIGIITDVTQLKLAEAELNRKNAKLEEANAELRVSLERAQELQRLADQAAQAKTDFLAVMSHEIRTPLNGISGMASLLQGSGMDKEQQECVSIIQSCSQTLTEIISNILDFIKLESGRGFFHESAFGLEELVRGAMQTVEAQARQKGLSLVAAVEPSLPQVFCGDIVRLKQVLVNLLGNAVKFTEEGEVRLKITGQQTGGGVYRLRLVVRDTGIGIDPGKRNQLFKVFSQLDSSTTRRYGGTGLGLAICKRVVDAMGGEIGLNPDCRHGSEFFVELDLASQELAENRVGQRMQIMPEADFEEKLAVLVVDDDRINQRVASHILKRYNLTADVADRGEVALQMVAERDYDVIFMDMQMPGIDGLETTRRIRSREGHQPWIVALTANTLGQVRGEAKDAGMNDFLTKPVYASHLLEALRKYQEDSPAADTMATAG